MAEEIKFYNSWSKQREVFRPREAGLVRIYNCGPTVYKRPHLGNLRRFLFADILRRTLEMHGYRVREITNITDVGHLTQDELDAGEDKLEREARQEQVTVQLIAQRETDNFRRDLTALNIQAADQFPRATDHIKEMIDLIQVLMDKGVAYQTKVGVFFEVAKFKPYGLLSGNTVDKLAEGARLKVRKEKRAPADFALWLTDDPDHLQQWDSPWGRGYPGWHIECSAMSLKYLGSGIDIHTGGEDNKFPHHENEIAQAEAATAEKFVHYWMHNAHLQIDGEKLAKREGRQVTLDSIRAKGFTPMVFRWLVMASHYRSPIDFTWQKMREARANLDKLKGLIRRVLEMSKQPTGAVRADVRAVAAFKQGLADDLNTPDALAVLQCYITAANGELDRISGSGVSGQEARQRIWATLTELDRVLGVMNGLMEEMSQEEVPAAVAKLSEAREAARRERNYQEADRLKKEIMAAGFKIEDTSDGYRLLRK